MATSRATARMKKITAPHERLRYEVTGMLLLALAAFVLISLYTSTGIVGRAVLQFLEITTGNRGIYMAALLFAYLGGILCYTRSALTFNSRNVGVVLLFLVILTLFHFLLAPHNLSRGTIIAGLWDAGVQKQGSGIIGAILSICSIYLLGWTGTLVLLITLSGIDLVLLTGVSTRSMLAFCGQRLAKGGKAINSRVSNFLFVEEEGADEKRGVTDKSEGKQEHKGDDEQQHFKVPVIIDYNATLENESASSTAPTTPVVAKSETLKKAVPNQRPYREDYTLPSLELLTPGQKVKSGRLNKEIIENVRIVEETLESFGVKISVTQVHRGPVITRYEVQPAPGVKVSRIVRLADDIALSLAAPAVRIEAPIPGKAALGIEVPNKEIAPVFLREILECPEFQNAASKLSVALGKDIAGNPIVTDLAKMPHLLIAGATGSGKSVCLNTLICSILYKATPNEVKFLLIDPKMVELTTYNGIPHLLAPVVTEPKKAASALKWVVSEMENRYTLFASLGVRDITRYNQCSQENGQQYQPLPYIIVLIDELADLMMIAPVDVEDAICRLAQMARAAGIHLVIATQRPSVDVITGIIKANIPSRIAFAVSSQTDSRTILDLNGAEKLLGRGDMLFLPVGLSKPLRIQGPLVTEVEVEGVVAYITKQGEPIYLSEFPDSVAANKKEADELGDPLFGDAAKLIMEMGHGSVSLLQRRFRVGYSRAARIMDLLEEKGVVGPSDGAKPRTVLMTAEHFRRYLER